MQGRLARRREICEHWLGDARYFATALLFYYLLWLLFGALCLVVAARFDWRLQKCATHLQCFSLHPCVFQPVQARSNLLTARNLLLTVRIFHLSKFCVPCVMRLRLVQPLLVVEVEATYNISFCNIITMYLQS